MQVIDSQVLALPEVPCLVLVLWEEINNVHVCTITRISTWPPSKNFPACTASITQILPLHLVTMLVPRWFDKLRKEASELSDDQPKTATS